MDWTYHRRSRPQVRVGLWLAIAIALAGCSGEVSHRAQALDRPDIVRIGNVISRPGVKEIMVPGYISCDRGILEYLAVVSGGKEYESVIALECRPSSLHAACLSIGGKIGDFPEEFIETEAESDRPENNHLNPGSSFHIEVTWKGTDGIRKRVPAERFFIMRKTGRPIKDAEWLFTGSLFVKDLEENEIYLADATGSVVGIWYDDSCVFNLPAKAGNPYRGETLGFEVNSSLVPPAGTKVDVVFRLLEVRNNQTKRRVKK